MKKLGNWLLGIFKKKKCCKGVCKGHTVVKKTLVLPKAPEPKKAPEPETKEKLYNGWDNFGD
jgi:hypothetical protein